MLGRICEAQGIPFAYGSGRLEDRKSLRDDIAAAQPSHVFNAAGATGRPNVEWCEFNKIETLRSNVIGALNIADVEELIKDYENVCILRVRMPIMSDLTHPRNTIKKISGYKKVVNIPNSFSVLDELIPISVEMAKRKLTGVWNFTNPDVVSHNELLEMYREYVDPNFTWNNFTVEEQDKVLAAPRCNMELDISKLKREFPELLPIKESAIKYVFEPNKKKNLA
ncbi:hypothetical protein COLO4_07466 [Corchorus olitorius]|uniref:NAD-dependent epimerase/dehydratase n=1 Tax=Corchorus olitorius TaxID=93759 RepID=A0A1R3KJR8_9ROSI|nr:hypothetical protein COLO4_07466 [Corchorus olitorius]